MEENDKNDNRKRQEKRKTRMMTGGGTKMIRMNEKEGTGEEKGEDKKDDRTRQE